jgi:uncharacterized protein (DUF58 family)
MVQELADGTLLDAIRGVHWPARRVTRGVHQGGHRSRRVGSSPEFMQYREYRPGDEVSKIDWKLFGRTSRIAVRQTHDDSDLRTTVVVDASASMAYPQATLGKWNLAAAVALGLCAVTQADRDPVGLAVVSGADVEILPPRARLSVTANAFKVLSATTPSGSRPLAPVLPALRSSSRIAIISDFLGDAEALLDVVGEMVVSGREVFAVHVIAREELEPTELGNLVVDPEDSTVRRPLDEAGAAEYRRAFATWRAALAERWRAAGVVYHLAITDEAAAQVVRRVVTPAAPFGEAGVVP